MKLTDKPLWITIQYICVLFLSVCLLGLIVSDLIFVWVIAMFFWLFIPAFIVACISFVCSLRCNSKHKKILLGLNGVNILLISLIFLNPFTRCDADIMEIYRSDPSRIIFIRGCISFVITSFAILYFFNYETDR